ncbi:MAG: prolipoprotein diacylglyceryl transferase [Oscillospiraceae bacterium]|nr:prolipoprotein diacylglyceryl transferase [Oscillospiraceae bacterium]
MEKIAFITNGSFIYWSSIILTLAVVTAIAVFVALYSRRSGNGLAICLMIPLSIASSLVLSRFIHWYCRADSYASMSAAMTDYSSGGYALMGAFGACLLCACALRLVRIVKNLPQMLDCMALAGGAGIAVGRLASFYNTSARGMVMPENMGLPFAWQITNAVSGQVENRLATFMLQSVVTAVIVIILLIQLSGEKTGKRTYRDGDICLLFLSAYGGSQIILDSTRYDSLFMRSNGFISIVQILGAVAVVLAIVVFSVRMVKNRGMRPYFVSLWVVVLAMLGVVGYMEYHVQRHGDQALFAYTVMTFGILILVAVTVLIHRLGIRKIKKASFAR